MSRTYTKEELKEILVLHAKWLCGARDGARADLRSADLRSADLRSANLSYANLSYANLRSANLSSADLSYADLRSADLRSADLRSANLSYANLSYANLRSANLSSADLSYANLSSADLSYAKNIDDAHLNWWIVPEEDRFVCWKAVRSKTDGRPIVLKLEVPPEAKRSCCYSSRKVRVEMAVPLAAFEKGGEPCNETEFCSDHDRSFTWRLAEHHRCEEFEVNPQIECGPGLHVWITRKEAAQWL